MLHIAVDDTSSTNDLARAHAVQGGELPALFTARRQHAGRGRMGHTFLSEEGGLYMSLCLRPQHPAEGALRLTTLAAVVAAEVLEEHTGHAVDIKWVNDLYMQGRKVAGILTEGVLTQEGTLSYAVIGIGINLAHIDFPPELAAIATSVADVTGRTLDPAVLARQIAHRLLHTDVLDARILAAYRRRLFVLGRPLTVLRGEDRYEATAVDLRDDGALIVRLPDGRTEALLSGDVRIKPQ